MKSIFYAWQSQLPNKSNRTLIEEALSQALKKLAQEARELIEFQIDQDTRGTVGSPEISSTILQKINDCSVFVADITPVGTLKDGKLTPNPNVLFELGFAWHKLGENRVILVLNETYGSPEDLPFDISKRCLVRYKFDPTSTDGPGNVRTDLSSQFIRILSAMWHDDQLLLLREDGLNDIDIALFKAVYGKILENDEPICDFELILEMGKDLGLNEEGLNDVVQLIADAQLWEAAAVMGSHSYSHVRVRTLGMERYCHAFFPGYHSLRDKIAGKVIEGTFSKDLSKALGKPEILIEHILELLESNDYIRTSKTTGGVRVLELKAKLKRLRNST